MPRKCAPAGSTRLRSLEMSQSQMPTMPIFGAGIQATDAFSASIAAIRHRCARIGSANDVAFAAISLNSSANLLLMPAPELYPTSISVRFQLEAAMIGRASDDDALKLVVTFYCIMEPEKRAEVVALAERFARESQVVEGCSHYLMLQDRGTRGN